MSTQKNLAVRVMILIFFTTLSIQSYSQYRITQILGYEHQFTNNTWSSNIAGKDGLTHEGYTTIVNSENEPTIKCCHTMIVIKIEPIPGKKFDKYKPVSRKLKVTAYKGVNGEMVGLLDTKVIVVKQVDGATFVPMIFNEEALGLTIKAELMEVGKVVSTKKQPILLYEGD
jgi:hypothetical protein